MHQGLKGPYKNILTTYWQHTIDHLENDTHDYKLHQLPLARIKKVMKADPEVKMISAEAPILFAKGCDIFITELTMRAWIHAEENKRRTLQRSDIASALSMSDMFDFLIDIVPREEAAGHAKRAAGQAGAANAAAGQPQMGGMPAQNHTQHMGAEYGLPGHPMGGEADYRQAQNMYPGQVPTGAPNAYGQPQQPMYEVDPNMYSSYTMQPPQVSALDPIHNGNTSKRPIVPDLVLPLSRALRSPLVHMVLDWISLLYGFQERKLIRPSRHLPIRRCRRKNRVPCS